MGFREKYDRNVGDVIKRNFMVCTPLPILLG
jgi:hypothetical protein